MANLLITNRCNRNCTFCFAQRRVNMKAEDKFMSREAIRKYMDFLERTGEMNLRLLGGEPTLHPEIIDIVEEGIQRKFHVHLFTNGIISKKIVNFLAEKSDEQISFLCNISPQAKDSERKVAMRNYALEKLGQKVALGITLTSNQFEYSYIIEHIKKFNLKKKIRIGIAQPIVGKDNDYLDPKDYASIGKPIVEMAKTCIKDDILIGFDCGMTLCMFTEEELGILMTRAEGFKSLCSPIIDIGLKLDVWSCFPLSEVLVTELDNFAHNRDIVDYYRKKLRPYSVLGCKPECLKCDYKKRGQCNGGCLAHAINALNRKPPKVAPDFIKTSEVEA